MQPRNTWLDSICYRLSLALRMGLCSCVLLPFVVLSLVDAGLRFLWPSWRSREDAPRWVGAGLVYLVTKFFPLVLVVPCSTRRPYRVVRLEHPRSLRPGEYACAKFSIQNSSSEVWQGGAGKPCRVGVVYPLNGSAFHVPGEWLNSERPAELPPGTAIPPSIIADFNVPIQAPKVPRRYRETWGLLIEGRGWLPTLSALDVWIEVVEEPDC